MFGSICWYEFKLCLTLFIGYKFKLCLFLFAGYGPKFYLTLTIICESRFCLFPLLLFLYPLWQQAMIEELFAFYRVDTWYLVLQLCSTKLNWLLRDFLNNTIAKLFIKSHSLSHFLFLVLNSRYFLQSHHEFVGMLKSYLFNSFI